MLTTIYRSKWISAGASKDGVREGGRDSALYVAPGMNHGGHLLTALPSAQKAKATADLLSWAGVSPQQARTFSVPWGGEDPMLTQRPPL